MSKLTIGKRNVTLGDYRVAEARPSVHAVEAATWRVYYRQAADPMSEHETRKGALDAVKRYQAADARRRA